MCLLPLHEDEQPHVSCWILLMQAGHACQMLESRLTMVNQIRLGNAGQPLLCTSEWCLTARALMENDGALIDAVPSLRVEVITGVLCNALQCVAERV